MLPATRIGPVGNARPGPFLEGIHGLRAIAALSVVIFHSGGAIGSEKYQHLIEVKAAVSWMDAGVDLFFVISGFVITLPLFLGRQEALGTYALHRVLRIYPVAMLTAAIFAMLNGVVYGRGLTLEGIASSFLLLPSDDLPVPIVLWTLKQELLFYAFVGICFLHRRVGLVLLTIWAIASVLIEGETAVGRWFFQPRNIEFLCGMVAAYAYVAHPVPTRFGAPVALAGLVVFGVLAVLAAEVSRDILSPLLGVAGLVCLYGAASSSLRLPVILLTIGTASYSIYLIHYLLVSFCNKVLTHIVPDLPGMVALVILASVATGAGYVYFLFAERRIERWRKRLRKRTCVPSGIAK